MKRLHLAVAAALLVAPAVGVAANWTRMIGGQAVGVVKATMTVTPLSDWNRSAFRPSKKGESWTQNGLMLDELSFFSGIEPGEPIYRERAKKDEPLPKFRAGMLLPEVAGMVEGSHRILLGTSLFEVTEVAPARFLGSDGVRFGYRFAVQGEEVRRRGEGRAAIVGGKLYLVTFSAPAIHYFDAGIGEARAMMDGARLP